LKKTLGGGIVRGLAGVKTGKGGNKVRRKLKGPDLEKLSLGGVDTEGIGKTTGTLSATKKGTLRGLSNGGVSRSPIGPNRRGGG